MKRPDLVLAGAVLICLPMVPSFMSGTLTPLAALERFLLALVVSWVGGALLAAVVTRYANQARQAEIVRQLEEARRPGTDPRQPDQITPPG